MTATLTAPSIEKVAPHVTTRVKPGDLARAQFTMIGLGLVLLGAAAVLELTGAADAKKRFWFSYLVGYMGVLGICLGALFFTMLQHITRAGWSVSVRRVAENVASTLPFMLLLFIPIFLGFHDLYHHWLEPDPADHVIAGKSGYLNSTFFFVRVGIYFAIWIGLATYFRRASIAQDQSGDPAISLRLSRLAAPGLLLFALSISFAAFDWIMSLDPHWFSTIFGVTYFAGAFMAFLAFAILLCKWLGAKGYLREVVTTEHYHDLGKLLFGFVVFWTYVNFSQYMLIWYANLPEETAWFAHRQHGGWGAVGTILVFGHFFIPFAFLMSRHMKRNTVTLCTAAVFLLVVHWIDMQFLILPNVAHGAAVAEHAPASEHAATVLASFTSGLGEWLHQMHAADALCFFGILSLIVGVTLFNIRRTSLLPTRDPRLLEALSFQNV
jgi:hypothetical protein